MQELRSGDLTTASRGRYRYRCRISIFALSLRHVVAVIIGIGMWILLGAFGGMFALIYIAFFLVSSIGVPLLAHLLGKKIGQQMVETRSDLHVQLVDSVQGIADLVAFGQEQRQAEQIQTLNKKLKECRWAWPYQWSAGQLDEPTDEFDRLDHPALRHPVVLAVSSMASFLRSLCYRRLPALRSCYHYRAHFSRWVAASKRRSAIRDCRRSHQPLKIQWHIDATSRQHHRSWNISISAITITSPYVLQDISFTLPQGRLPGAGRAKWLREIHPEHLLLRFWDYQEGHIQFGGHELQSISKTISTVCQCG